MFKSDILKCVVCLYVFVSIHSTPSDGEHPKRVGIESHLISSVRLKQARKSPNTVNGHRNSMSALARSTPTRPTVMDNWGCNSRRQDIRTVN
ncbi:hypothetical protein CDAR_15661 [Caerostris darwini]|uniref:Secreted protein n=1 Tax=Caerostris darwini TaxID=1538125 RepID=A0AAV4U7P4_9ARAC|nr:hypothetical protein CDAR_15661 [Caerostris darwini]